MELLELLKSAKSTETVQAPAYLVLAGQPAATRNTRPSTEASQPIYANSRRLHHQVVRVVHDRKTCRLRNVT